MNRCEAGCGHVEWVVTLASCKVFLVCGEIAMRVLTLAGERDVPSRLNTLEGAARELAGHYVGNNEQRYQDHDRNESKRDEWARLHWRNRAAG
jgi:hypothetical protein